MDPFTVRDWCCLKTNKPKKQLDGKNDAPCRFKLLLHLLVSSVECFCFVEFIRVYKFFMFRYFFLECLQNSILKGISVFFCHKLYLQYKKKYEQSSYRLIHNSTRGRVSTNQCNAMLKIQKNKEKCRSSQKKYFQLSQLKLKMYT